MKVEHLPNDKYLKVADVAQRLSRTARNGFPYNTKMKIFLCNKLFNMSAYDRHQKKSQEQRERIINILYFFSENKLIPRFREEQYENRCKSYINMCMLKYAHRIEPNGTVDRALDNINIMITRAHVFMDKRKLKEQYEVWREENEA